MFSRREFLQTSTLVALAPTIAYPAATAKIGAPAPAFALADSNGKTVSLADFKGKTVVLEWTNPDCPFVQRHYKEKTMAKLAETYKDKGVVWLSINSSEDANPKETPCRSLE